MTVGATASPTAPTTATDSTGAGRTRLAENFDMFLTLLTTQMKNQDPTSPMDSTQFMSQLVQMTGVEQQLAGNDLLKQLVANTSSGVASAVSLIGKEVRAASGDAKLANDKAKWVYSLGAEASDVKIEVLDSKGRTVHVESASAADSKAGEHTYVWDGKDNTGAKEVDGVYTLRITAKDTTGAKVVSNTYVQGRVTGVEQGDGGAILTINGGKVGIGQVISINEAATSSTTTGSTTDPGADPTNPADQTSAAAA